MNRGLPTTEVRCPHCAMGRCDHQYGGLFKCRLCGFWFHINETELA
jgi:hypothetical protein